MFISASYEKYFQYLPEFLLALATSFILAPIFGYIARKSMIVGFPPSMRERKKTSDFRHLEKQPTPLLGGLAVTLPLIVLILIHTAATPQIIFLIFSLLLLVIMGIFDDVFELSGRAQLITILIAAIIISISPFNFEDITNPMGGMIDLSSHKWVGSFIGMPLEFVWPGDLLMIFWILACSISVKVSAGTDGLMEGNTLISTVIMFILAIRFEIRDAAMISTLFSGLLIGFLIFNFYPAKIRSGSVGKSSYGFILAILSISVGARVATSILLLLLPIIDFIWVLIGRYRKHKPKNIFSILAISDQTHLHYRLLHIGLSELQVAFSEYLITLTLGAIVLAASGALRAFVILVGLIAIVVFVIYITSRERKKQTIKRGENEESPEKKYSY
jgi:UDP-GlcNAc:undecaprenyl-phosphate GlcNAc-1-phosphate transferase